MTDAVEKVWIGSVESWDSGDSGYNPLSFPQDSHSLFHRFFTGAAVFFLLIPAGHRAY